MLQVDVFHDTVCPWCRIGKAYLQQAIAQWEGEPVKVRYHAFYLNPGVPPEGYEFRPYMHARLNGQIPLEELFARPAQVGAAAGLTFNFDRIERAPNTTLSHQLAALAGEGEETAVIDAIYKAYFEDGRDIGDLDVLVDIGAALGMEPDALREKLEQGAGRERVDAEVEWARDHGISGVPFFIINNKYTFSGAQPPHMISRVFAQAAAEHPVVADGLDI